MSTSALPLRYFPQITFWIKCNWFLLTSTNKWALIKIVVLGQFRDLDSLKRRDGVVTVLLLRIHWASSDFVGAKSSGTFLLLSEDFLEEGEPKIKEPVE